MKRQHEGEARTRKKKALPQVFRQDVLDEADIDIGGLENLPDTATFFPPRDYDIGEDNKKRLEAVRRAWKTLSEQQKKILAIVENWSYTREEIDLDKLAKRLKISKRSVTKQIERARAKILLCFNNTTDKA